MNETCERIRDLKALLYDYKDDLYALRITIEQLLQALEKAELALKD